MAVHDNAALAQAQGGGLPESSLRSVFVAEQNNSQETGKRPQATLPAVQGQTLPATDAASASPPAQQGQVVRTLHLGRQGVLDLTNLPTHQADALEAKALEKEIERHDRREQLKEDIAVTAAQLATFSKAVADSTQQNAAVTITNTKDDSLGRTEMILGNSDAAQSGKLSRSQQGLSDNAKFWIVLASIAAVVIVVVALLRR